MFSKIYTRFVHWELFDDEDIHMAGLALKVMANSGQIVNLVVEKNIKKLIFWILAIYLLIFNI